MSANDDRTEAQQHFKEYEVRFILLHLYIKCAMSRVGYYTNN